MIMEYQKIANLLDTESNQPSRFRTRNWVEINDASRGTYISNDIRFKTAILRSSLCDYEDAYILVKGTITITGNNGNIKDAEIIIPLKYLSNFWRTLEMPLINCEVNLILTWSKDCGITNFEGSGKSKITETKLYVPVVTLATQDNAKLLQQLKSGFKRTVNWNKYESSPKTYAQNRYLNDLINPSFQQTFCIIF